MGKLFTLTTLALFLPLAPSARAQTKFIPVPVGLTYTTQKRGALGAKEVQEVAALATSLVSRGLEEVAAEAGNGEAIFGVDQVFWNAPARAAVFLKLDVAPAASLNDKFLTDNDSFLYHGKTPSGMTYALYLVNFTPTEARDTVAGIDGAFKKIKTARLLSPIKNTWQKLNPICEAHAGESAHVTGSAKSAEIQADPAKSLPATVAQNVWTCTKGVGGAVYDSTVGLAQKVGFGAVKVVAATGDTILHPITAWGKVVEGFKSFVGMIGKAFGYWKYDVGIGRTEDKLQGYEQALAEGKTGGTKAPAAARASAPQSAYSKLSPSDKIKFVCNMVAKVGIVGVSWMFAPGNAVGLASQVATFMNTSVQLSTFELGRQLFMEVQYSEVADGLESKRRKASQEQIEFSREWARKNPEEAAKIVELYRNKKK